jgi:hypothetical protein
LKGTKVKKTRSISILGASLTTLILLAGPVSAHSSTDKTTDQQGNETRADVWIQNFSWSSCGDFATSAWYHDGSGNLKNATWIKNTATARPVGGSGSFKGVSVSGQISDSSLYWKNDNSYFAGLSGSVCGSLLTIYLGLESTATTFGNGTPRTVSAQV